MIAFPPSNAGALNEISIALFLGINVFIMGASGNVRGVAVRFDGTTVLPTALVAII